MRKLAIAIAVVTAFLLNGLSATPASAGPLCSIGWSCGHIGHVSPDNGYDDAFLISCKWGNGVPVAGYSHYVAEGHNSGEFCEDMDGVYVNSGTEIACYVTAGVYAVVLDATGWHKVQDNWQYHACIYQLD